MKKIIIFALIILAIIVISRIFGEQFSLANIKALLEPLRSWRAEHNLLFAVLFFALYVAVAATSLPFATVLTLLGGAIMGFWQGLIVVSLASTTGATIAFLASRYLLSDFVQNRFGNRLKTINDGIEQDGAFYLFTLRMVPLFPFFLVNLLMGLTPMKTRTYIWVSWLGMLPATAVYVYAGRNLGQLESLSGILSPQLILSLTLLGVFPLIAKWFIGKLNARKVYDGFTKPQSYDRNLVVIGAGSAGLVASYMGAYARAKVTLVETNLMGGDCLNFGCVPSKALIKTSRIAAQMKHADQYGLKPHQVEFDLSTVAKRVQDVVAAIEPNDSVERYQSMGVDVVKGYAKIVDPWHVEITPQEGEAYTLSTKGIVIASGAEPFVPPIDGLKSIDHLTSDNLWSALSSWDKLPENLLVLGGGNIGCELSQAFARLGSNVTIVEMAATLLSREDPEVSQYANSALEADGIRVLTSHKAVKFEENKCFAEFSGQTTEIPFDAVLVAVGRKARVEGFGLEELGIKVDRTVLANAHLQTNFPNIYVAGDAVGPYQFTHTAGYEGTYAGLNALFGNLWKFKMDYRVVPAVTFTDPEIARVGLNETEAIAQGIEHEVTLYPFEKLDRAETESETQGFIKIITPKGKDTILGVTIVGAHAGDLLAEFALAMKYKIGLKKILGTIHAYPTWAEGVKNSAGAWSNAHVNEKLLRLPEWYLKRARK